MCVCVCVCVRACVCVCVSLCLLPFLLQMDADYIPIAKSDGIDQATVGKKGKKLQRKPPFDPGA